ncbi:MAG: hypothetical protein J2P23_05955 [Microlunatus sp.]|nr:hypothetical protein [Microlunatus sp.]
MIIFLITVIVWLLGALVLVVIDEGNYKLDELLMLAAWPVSVPYFQVRSRLRKRKYLKIPKKEA